MTVVAVAAVRGAMTLLAYGRNWRKREQPVAAIWIKVGLAVFIAARFLGSSTF